MATIVPRRGEFFTIDGEPTTRFITWMESLTSEVNTTTEIIESPSTAAILSQLGTLKSAVEEMGMIVASKSETAALRRGIDDLMLLSNNKAEITDLRQRISDLELQQ